MKCINLYETADGESHWRDVDVDLRERLFAPPAQRIRVSSAETAKSFVLLKLEAGWNEPVHPSPRRQILIALRGRVLVTASDGEVREIRAGDVWRMEDVAGKGHHTRVVGDVDFEAAVVQIE